jgi:hypothetical protein
MKRVVLFSTACACALWVASAALSQSGGGGGGGGAGGGGAGGGGSGGSAGSASASGGAGSSASAGANPGTGARGGANVGGAGTTAAAGANRNAARGQAGAAVGQPTTGLPNQQLPPGGVWRRPYDGIPQNPFFANPGVRRDIGLHDNQFNQLNTAYGQAWQRYNQGLQGRNLQTQNRNALRRGQGQALNNRAQQNNVRQRAEARDQQQLNQQRQNLQARDLNDQRSLQNGNQVVDTQGRQGFRGEQRSLPNERTFDARTFQNDRNDMRMLALEQAFDDQFGRSIDTALTDPDMRQRFNQLRMQFRGFGAFNSPQVQQQLNLTPQQQQQFRLLAQDWRQDLGQLNRLYASDPALATERFNMLRQQFDNQLGTVLSAQQLQTWRSMVGEPFAFDATMFLGDGTARAHTSARLDPTGDRTRANVNQQLRAQDNDLIEDDADLGEGAGVDVGTSGTDREIGTEGTDEEADFDSDPDDDVRLDVEENVDDLDGDNQNDAIRGTDADRSVDDSAAR